MGKNALMGTSLVAAVPAGYLVFLMVQVFLTQTENMETMMYVVAGTTLAIGAIVALMPIGILLFTPSSKVDKPKDEEAVEEDDAPAAVSDEISDDEMLSDDEFEDDDAADDEYEFEDDDDEDWK